MVEDFEVEAEIIDLLCSLASVSDVAFLLSKEEIELLFKSIGECDDGCINLKETIASRLKKFFRIALVVDTSFEPILASNPYAKSDLYSDRFSARTGLFYDGFLKESLSSLGLESDLIRNFKDFLLTIVSNYDDSISPLDTFILIDQFKTVFLTKKAHLLDRSDHYKKGVDKINEARAAVDVLSKEATLQEIQLQEKQVEADRALKQITERMVRQ
jgi:hypothetical protein